MNTHSLGKSTHTLKSKNKQTSKEELTFYKMQKQPLLLCFYSFNKHVAKGPVRPLLFSDVVVDKATKYTKPPPKGYVIKNVCA